MDRETAEKMHGGALYLPTDGDLLREQAACLARLAGAGKLLLGHFSARYPDPCCLLPEAQALFPNTCVCSDGDVYEVPAVKRLV